MSGLGVPLLDRDRIRELFDLRKNAGAEVTAVTTGTIRIRRGESSGRALPYTLAPSTSSPRAKVSLLFHGLPFPDRPHFSAFTFAACDEAYRNDKVFASSPNAVDPISGHIGHDTAS